MTPAEAKVLIIDDDAALRRLIRRILTAAGHPVVEARDGADGMRRFAAEAPALVITDIIMPDQEGMRTILDIRAAGSRVGVIAMSGGGVGRAQDYLDMAVDLGADAALRKPFRPNELLALVARLLAASANGR